MVNAMPSIFFGHGNPMHALTSNPLRGGVATDRRADSKTEGDPIDLCALVCAQDSRDGRR